MGSFNKIIFIYSVIASGLICVLVWQNYVLKNFLKEKTPSIASVVDETLYDSNTNHSPYIGNENAPIVIVCFSDYQCPACSMGPDTINRLMRDFPDQIRFYLKHLPLDTHKESRSAISASMAAHMQGRFWDMHSAIMDSQSHLDESLYFETAGELNLNLDLFEKDFNSELWSDLIQSDIYEAGAFGVTEIPAYFVNGIRISDSSYTNLKETIGKIIEELNSK